MTSRYFRSAAVLASLASLALAATPALARDRWGGWGGGWGRHHDRVDAGDVLAGVLIIGGIAAVASAASKAARDRRYEDGRYDTRRDQRDYRGDVYRGDDYRGEDYRGENYRGGEYRGEGDRSGEPYRSGPGADYRGVPGGDYPVAGERDGTHDDRGQNEAVDRCVSEIERNSGRVESVDKTERDSDGWTVEGRINGDDPFTCKVDLDGRIRRAAINGHAL